MTEDDPDEFTSSLLRKLLAGIAGAHPPLPKAAE